MNRTVSPFRGPLTSVSALLVVGLLVGTSLRTIQPGVRDVQRDSGSDRAAVRQLTETLARAVRELVGSDTHKPHAAPAIRSAMGEVADHGRRPAPAEPPAEFGRHLRTELLDLPPPAMA